MFPDEPEFPSGSSEFWTVALLLQTFQEPYSRSREHDSLRLKIVAFIFLSPRRFKIVGTSNQIAITLVEERRRGESRLRVSADVAAGDPSSLHDRQPTDPYRVSLEIFLMGGRETFTAGGKRTRIVVAGIRAVRRSRRRSPSSRAISEKIRLLRGDGQQIARLHKRRPLRRSGKWRRRRLRNNDSYVTDLYYLKEIHRPFFFSSPFFLSSFFFVYSPKFRLGNWVTSFCKVGGTLIRVE